MESFSGLFWLFRRSCWLEREKRGASLPGLLCFAGKLESVLSRICLEQSEISNREIVNRFTWRGVLQRPKMVVDYMLDCGLWQCVLGVMGEGEFGANGTWWVVERDYRRQLIVASSGRWLTCDWCRRWVYWTSLGRGWGKLDKHNKKSKRDVAKLLLI